MWEEIGPTKRFAGASGTVTIPDGAIVIFATAHCTTAGTMAMSDGQGGTVTIPIPAASGFAYDPKHKGGPRGGSGVTTIVFTGTDAYFVEVTGVGF